VSQHYFLLSTTAASSNLISNPQPTYHRKSKSVYVKQVGVIVFLAHVGSYVPCDRAIIGLTDRILTRISSIESICSPLSSFPADLTQVSKMLASATDRSLCLLDEVS
jgi:DNA mismatch repair protein MSH5